MTDAPYRILVVEDDAGMRASLVALLEAAAWQVTAVARADKAQAVLPSVTPDVILSDVRMPGMSGLDLLQALTAQDGPPVVLISAHGDIPLAVAAMQDGAYSFVEKPYEPRRLLTILRHAADQSRMQASNARLRARLMELAGLDRVLLGQTPAIRDARTRILDLAQIAAPVLVLGETGTGKDLVARALHDLGPQADGPFVAVNCALLSPDHFATEMFGVSGGVPGRIMQADRGTLFLDEICACPLPAQAAFLRVLEEGEVTPQGAAAPVPVRLRVLSATNEDIAAAVASGSFREDLFFRLNTFSLTLPPLRDRRDDLQLLAAHFMQAAGGAYDVTPPPISTEDLAALLAHDWPGNLRELRNVAERRVLAARRGQGSMAEAIAGTAPDNALPDTLREAVASLERDMISRAVVTHEGRMDDTAAALGIGRRTLNEKIVKLGLDKDALL